MEDRFLVGGLTASAGYPAGMSVPPDPQPDRTTGLEPGGGVPGDGDAQWRGFQGYRQLLDEASGPVIGHLGAIGEH